MILSRYNYIAMSCGAPAYAVNVLSTTISMWVAAGPPPEQIVKICSEVCVCVCVCVS